MLQGNLFASNNKFKRQQQKTVLALEDNFKSFRVKDEKFTNYFETNKDNINTINSEIASIKSKNSEQDSSISSINSEISSIKSRLDALEAK